MSAGASPHEVELGEARGRLKDTLARVTHLKKQLEAFLKTLKNWAHCTDTACACLADAVDAERFPAGREIARWAQQQAALNERVGGSLAEQFDAAVMKPVLAWLESFKVVKEMLKEYQKAWTTRKHYEDKVGKLKVAQMKGKAKPDKVQRNLRKLDAARSEYARSEASTVRDTRAFFTKCHNNFISVAAMFARFHERLGREFNNEWQANGPWAVQILRMKEDDLPVPAIKDGNRNGGGTSEGGRAGSFSGSENRESSGSFGGGSQHGGGGRDSQMSAHSSGVESGRSSFASSPQAAANDSSSSSSSSNNTSAGDAWGANAPADGANNVGTAGDDGFGDWGNDGAGAAGSSSAGGNDDGFGDWGDMGQQQVAPGRPRRKSSPTPADADGGFGAFGDFAGGNGGFAAAPAALAPLPSRPARKSSPSTASADDGFGAFGDFGDMNAAVPPSGPAPLPPQPVAAEGQQQAAGQRRDSNPFLDFF